jgi:carotenoid cleavage dioxygenase
MPPYLTYHRLSADGELVTSAEIAVPGPTMMHDFAITDRHAVFLDLPMTFSLDRVAAGMPFGWDDAYGARLGVMPLDRPGEVRWFDVDPSYVFHVGNAHTDAAGRVVLDAARYAAADAAVMWDQIGRDPAGLAADAAATGMARLHRWVLDPATGTVTETPLHERGVEFPTVDDARVGRAARYRYAVADSGKGAAVIKFDAEHGTATEHDLGADTVAGEAVFVPSPAPGRAEDDGWLLTITTRRDGSASRLLVLDATDVAGRPVAAVTLPRGVPAGFHGSWIDDAELGIGAGTEAE